MSQVPVRQVWLVPWLVLVVFIASGCPQQKVRDASARTGAESQKRQREADAAMFAMPRAPEPDKAISHNTEAYAHIQDNHFFLAKLTPLSTFSIDVDTASYTNVRRFLLQDKTLPSKDAVRVEELINYFTYDDPEPTQGHPIGIRTEIGPCPWNRENKLVRIALKAMSVPLEKQPPRNLVFLIDTSGSMTPPDRLPLLVEGLGMLVETLRPKDRVAIVAYAGSAGLVLPSTPGTDKATILGALNRLQAGGSTNGGEGISLAYTIAQQNLIEGGLNRVIIGTDGDFNVGTTSEGELVRLIEEKRQTGVYLSVLGFGRGNLKDSTMEKLAHHGNGHFAYIDSKEEAKRIFVERGAALQLVATDVKVQVEFNPANVQAYRLIGYENRLMKDQDFNDDTKDAGDIGSGHTVTALYEIVPPGVTLKLPDIDPLRYQNQASKDVTLVANSSEMLNVKVRYKDPGATASELLTQPVEDSKRSLGETSVDFRFASAVAEFALLLRQSPHKGSANFAELEARARDSIGPDLQRHRTEFLTLIGAARQLSRGN